VGGAARAGADQGELDLRRARRLVPADSRLDPRDPAGRPRDRPDDRRVVPVDRPGAAARVARRAPGPRERPAARDSRPGRPHRRGAEARPAARPAEPLLHQRGPADGRPADTRPLQHRHRQLQGGLAGDGRAVRRVAELRRQRHLHPLPGRWRLEPRQQRQLAVGDPLRQRLGEAARHPAEAPGQEPAEAVGRRLLQEPDPESGQRCDRTGAMRHAIRKHMRDFLAIIFLFIVAAGVSVYILAHERLVLPGWVPGGESFYTVNAEFSTAQAVVPGQGQTVNIAGVSIGNIGSVKLQNGVAVVQMKIKEKYKPVYHDATLLLRPKTGLKDMYIEMDPGNKSAGSVADGSTLPVSNTLPDVNLDEILSSLDSDSRSYLQILLGAGGQALGTDQASRDLRATFKRFEPTARYGAEITSLLSQR